MSKPYMRKGWTFEVKSWENDGDNKTTVKLTVVHRDEADAYADLIKLFDDDQIGNLFEPEDDEVKYPTEQFKLWATKHVVAFERITERKLADQSDESIWYTVLDLASNLGLAGRSEFTTRVPDGFTVFYCPEDVFLNDVTKDFK